MGAYTQSTACVREKVGLSATGLYAGELIGGEIRHQSLLNTSKNLDEKCDDISTKFKPEKKLRRTCARAIEIFSIRTKSISEKENCSIISKLTNLGMKFIYFLTCAGKSCT